MSYHFACYCGEKFGPEQQADFKAHTEICSWIPKPGDPYPKTTANGLKPVNGYLAVADVEVAIGRLFEKINRSDDEIEMLYHKLHIAKTKGST